DEDDMNGVCNLLLMKNSDLSSRNAKFKVTDSSVVLPSYTRSSRGRNSGVEGTTGFLFIQRKLAEMTDCGSSDGSNQGFSFGAIQEKGSRNKRKYLADFSLDVPVDTTSSSLTEFPRYELLEENIRKKLSDLETFEAMADQLDTEEIEEDCQSNWDDPIVSQLEELLSTNLSAIFQSATKRVAECGYSKEIAKWVVLRGGFDYGSKDVVSNIVDGALLYLTREKGFDTSTRHTFEDLQDLVEYTLVEMISVLREVKPSLSVAEAMWCLLICDLNLSHACGVEEGESSSVSTNPDLKSEIQSSETIISNHGKPSMSRPSNPYPNRSQAEIPVTEESCNLRNLKTSLVREMSAAGKESVISLPVTGGKLTSLSISRDYVKTVSQTMVEEQYGVSRKGCSGHTKKDILKHKMLHFEKNYKGRMSKGAFKAKLAGWGALVDKKLKSPIDSSGVNMKNSAAPLPKKEDVSALPAASTKPAALVPPETKATPQPQSSTAVSSKSSDYYAGMSYDKALGKYVPQDEKDEAILALVPQLQALEKELQGWSNWANEKVMQATRRLSKDRADLKTLRQEKEESEKLKKEKLVLEENTIKRLSEMEHALCNAAGQIEMANSTVCRLEEENNVLKKEMGVAKLEAVESAENLQEAVLREQETLKKAQSCEPQKGLLQEELTTKKREAADLQQAIEKVEVLHNQIEANRKYEEREKDKLLMHAATIRKERARLEALAEAEKETIRQKADNDMQKYKDGIKELESEISKLRLESESSKIEALRTVGYGGCLAEDKSTLPFQGYQAPKVSKRLAVFRDNFGAASLKPERECVMCLSEEKAVVFLPCAHQVLCPDCNVLHEKQGMNDCPSCRSPIQRRIHARFTRS
ncbi:hypothetical protein RJ639_013038, partial [Escallonia herrerae]